MARIDKVNIIVRATAGTVLSGVQAVTLDAGGSVVLAGTADAWGVTCPGGTIQAGSPVGVLKSGEIVEFSGVAGTDYYAQAGGTIGTASQPSSVGKTVEASRLVVSIL